MRGSAPLFYTEHSVGAEEKAEGSALEAREESLTVERGRWRDVGQVGRFSQESKRVAAGTTKRRLDHPGTIAGNGR